MIFPLKGTRLVSDHVYNKMLLVLSFYCTSQRSMLAVNMFSIVNSIVFQEYDACHLMKDYDGPKVEILIDQVCG